jgi:hypothetical protein
MQLYTKITTWLPGLHVRLLVDGSSSVSVQSKQLGLEHPVCGVRACGIRELT